MTGALRVRDYMATDVVKVPPEMEVTQVVNLLVERDVSGVLVVDAEDRLLGIVTERDCIGVAVQAGYFDERGGSVAEFMTRDVATVSPGDSLIDVAARMVEVPYRRFPVVEAGRTVGLLSRRDVLRALQSGAWFGAGTA